MVSEIMPNVGWGKLKEDYESLKQPWDLEREDKGQMKKENIFWNNHRKTKMMSKKLWRNKELKERKVGK